MGPSFSTIPWFTLPRKPHGAGTYSSHSPRVVLGPASDVPAIRVPGQAVSTYDLRLAGDHRCPDSRRGPREVEASSTPGRDISRASARTRSRSPASSPARRVNCRLIAASYASWCRPWPDLRAVPESARIVEVTGGGPARRAPVVAQHGQLADLDAHVPLVRPALLYNRARQPRPPLAVAVLFLLRARVADLDRALWSGNLPSLSSSCMTWLHFRSRVDNLCGYRLHCGMSRHSQLWP